MSVQAATERSGTGVSALSPPGFAGRQRELAALAGALDCPPAVVLVEGEAGVGKSRLVREFLAFPAAKTGRSLVACCPPFRQPCTLGPVADALRQAAGDVAGLRLSPLAGSLRPLLPEWAAGLPPAPEPLEDAGAARYRLYRALAEVLDCLRVRVLVAEDAHWADDATLEFLLFLAARQREGFSLVVTWRPEDVPAGSLLRRLSSRLPAGTTSARITLAPLDVAATAALVSSMLDGKPVSQEFAAFLHQRTDGLPLAVEETVRLMADRADLERRGGGWARRRLADIAVPPTVRDAVLERAGRLDSGAQAVLRAGGGTALRAADRGAAAERAGAGLFPACAGRPRGIRGDPRPAAAAAAPAGGPGAGRRDTAAGGLAGPPLPRGRAGRAVVQLRRAGRRPRTCHRRPVHGRGAPA